jgi:hypothetical protein
MTLARTKVVNAANKGRAVKSDLENMFVDMPLCVV